MSDLKGKNQLAEHQQLVDELKSDYQTFRNISFMSGISLKTVHNWCSKLKAKVHKASELARLRREEFQRFLLQDSISFAHPSKKFAGKWFLRDTLEVTRKKYLEQSEFHQYGIISMSSMKEYRPSYVMLCGVTPLDQCLCNKCENCEQLLKTLLSLGMKDIPANRYTAVDRVVCADKQKQAGCEFTFPQMKCIAGECELCGEGHLSSLIRNSNQEVLSQNKKISWGKWMTQPGRSAPDKSQVKGSVTQAIDELIEMTKFLKGHIFRVNWNHNIFDYIRKHLLTGYIVQIFDFAMNFHNLNQDEVQSAYWDGTQTCIHAVINYFTCPVEHCSEVVTLILAQITDDLHHDSFVAHVGHDSTFRFLAELGLPMDLIIQFCDNCSSQYKSRRPFAELARSPLDIIRVYFGEKHGKSHCDGFFGRLKALMTFKIKSRHVVINSANDFYRCCQEEYETNPVPDGQCQHYRVKFQFLKPRDI